jgi:L,D-peptidoglycan transpeptidase YkuD (ErfK/YbiS/YcfS/YnhG family)
MTVNMHRWGVLTRTSIALTSLAVGSLAAVALGSAPATAAVRSAIDPSTLPGIGSSEQVVLVTASNSRTSYATVRTYERAGDGSWRPVMKAVPARIGYSGLAPERVRLQGTGKTPSGTFAITTTLGRVASPATRMPYQQFDKNDAWTYNPKNPATYNMFQSADRAWSGFGDNVEHLWSYGSQYRYIAVLDYNLPTGAITTGKDGVRRTSAPANTTKGGGIFLHVSAGTATAGCVAVSRARMTSIMEWLDPAKHPVIVIGTTAALT